MQPTPVIVSGQSYPGTFVVPTSGPLVNSNQENQMKRYKQKPAHILGSIQMTIGVLCAIFNIVSLVVCSGNYDCRYIFDAYRCGYGIWCGAMFFVAGILGMFSGNGNLRKDLIIATMVMSIIAAIISSVSFSLGIMEASLNGDNRNGDYNYYPYYYMTTKKPTEKILTSMGALVAILSFIEAAMAIASSVLCCKAVCCCGSAVPMTYMPYYNPAMQQTMIYPQTGYIPQYGLPSSNAIPSNVNQNAPQQNFIQPQVQQGASGFQPNGATGQPPAYSEGLGRRDETKY